MKSGRFYLDYIGHWLTANTRHGTHSPFVYRLVEEVLYAPARRAEPRDKVQRLVARLVADYGVSGVYTPGTSPVPDRLDFVLLNGQDAHCTEAALKTLWPRFHAQSVLVITGIYQTAAMKQLWQTVRALPEVTVTIDLFRVGLVFFHAGQAREDFKIRL